MDGPALPLPEEPIALRSAVRTLLEQSPAAGLQLVAAGEWIAAPLWDRWRDALAAHGVDRAHFLQIVIGYQNELRLWVMGERPWEQCAAGLAGRAARRSAPATPRPRRRPSGPRRARSERSAPAASGPTASPARVSPAPSAAGPDEAPEHWGNALARAGVDAADDEATLRARIGRLGLECAVSSHGGGAGIAATDHHAIVWSGGRPRDPEVPFGEARSATSPAQALAEALGRFLVKDPAYPLR